MRWLSGWALGLLAPLASCLPLSAGLPGAFSWLGATAAVPRARPGLTVAAASSAELPEKGGVPADWVSIAASPHDPGRWEEDGVVLGQGAFGIVARGFNKETGELVAVKRVSATDRLAISTAKNEVEAAFALGEHPNVVQMKAHFLAPGSCEGACEMVLVYRLALGGDLQAWISHRHGSGFSVADYGRPRLTDEALRIMWQLTEGLQHAHSKAIQHRDLKPANILLSAGGTAIIADFGIALVNRSSSRGAVRSAPLGDFYFMDVESLVTKDLAYTLEDDIYSLGEVFVRILYGNYATGRELLQHVSRQGGAEMPAVLGIVAAMLQPRGSRCSLEEAHARLFAVRLDLRGRPSEPRPIVTTAFLGIGALVTAAVVGAWQRQKSLLRQKSVFSRKSRFQAQFHVSQTQGRRAFMDEYHCHSRISFGTSPAARSWRLLGVFDGHCGKDCSKFAARFLPHEVRRMLRRAEEHHDTSSMTVPSTEDMRVAAEALQAALESLNKLFVKFKERKLGGLNSRGFGYAGSTAATALISPDGCHAVLCNIGDSRAALAGDWRVLAHCGAAPKVSGSAIVTHPHSPGDPAEIERIERAGGFVELGHRGHRVNGALGVSRSLGYAGVAGFDGIVTAEADYVIARRCGKNNVKNWRPALVALATDGVFEIVGQEAAAEAFGRLLASKAEGGELGEAMKAELDLAGGAENVDNATLLACLLPAASAAGEV